MARARAAQRIADGYDQARVDELVAAAGWAIIEPARNRELAELAVADTGIGNVEDKIRKNHRKTLGLLRDLQERAQRRRDRRGPGARHHRDRAPGRRGVRDHAVDQSRRRRRPTRSSTRSRARNAVIVAPSPKGWSTCARLIEFIHAQFDRIGAPRDLVQMLPAPVTKEATAELMRQCDLVVATGSQANVRAAYASGTPAFGVGAGNVASIVDETADVADAAEQDRALEDLRQRHQLLVGEQPGDRRRRTRDRCWRRCRRKARCCSTARRRPQLQALMWPDGKLSPAVIGQSAATIAERAGFDRARRARNRVCCWSRRTASAPRIRSPARSSARC